MLYTFYIDQSRCQLHHTHKRHAREGLYPVG